MEEYLGDGVYARRDEIGRIWLDLRGQDSTTRICLEPRTLKAFDEFRERIRENDQHWEKLRTEGVQRKTE